MAGLFLCLSFMCVVPAGDLPTNRVHATPRAAPLKDWCLCPLGAASCEHARTLEQDLSDPRPKGRNSLMFADVFVSCFDLFHPGLTRENGPPLSFPTWLTSLLLSSFVRPTLLPSLLTTTLATLLCTSTPPSTSLWFLSGEHSTCLRNRQKTTSY